MKKPFKLAAWGKKKVISAPIIKALIKMTGKGAKNKAAGHLSFKRPSAPVAKAAKRLARLPNIRSTKP